MFCFVLFFIFLHSQLCMTDSRSTHVSANGTVAEREFFSTGVKPNSSIFTIDCLYFTFSEIQYHPKILLLLSQLNSQLNFPKIPNLAKQINNSN